jgi:YebC/PmpR family DNA-binding regulatory protein
MLVEVLTDNRNRTGSEIRNLLSKNGGSLAEPGAVAWQFERKGVLQLPRTVDEDELMLAALEAGAEDIAEDDDMWRVTTLPTDLHTVRDALVEAGMEVSESDVTMVANANIEIDDLDAARKVLRLIDILDDHDDVQNVFSNFDIPETLLEKLEA